MNSPEQPISPELRPVEKASMQEFLRNTERFSVGGFQDLESDDYASKSYALSDGRQVSVSLKGVISRDLYPEDPVAALWITEFKGDERKQTGYLLYEDDRMEKIVDIESIEQIKKEFNEDFGQMYQRRKLAANEERKLGLRNVTEVDMQETREFFAEIEKMMQKEKL